MCGIGGIVNFNGGPVDPRVLAAMNAAQRHRGPDGEGTYIAGAVGFAHTRLAIIDVEGGAQPFVDDERGMALSYNGEVYNYREIRDELAGHCRFQTASDTEVVLRAYQHWGIECLERFRGMFAFALHDRDKGRVYLVRDRIGIKPLYYAATPEHLVFGSELGAVTCDSRVARRIDGGAVANYLYHQYVPTPGTIYAGVNKLEPGHYAEIDVATGRIRQVRYWTLRGGRNQDSDSQRLAALSALLHDTIELYVRSDVPFGAFLSGGVDSSTVTALMGDHLESRVNSFTIGYDEEAHSELPFAETASRVLGTDHHARRVSPDDLIASLRGVVDRFGEPFGDSSAIPTFWVSKVAAERVKMVLSGDGGDEVFAGYNNYTAIHRKITKPRWMQAMTKSLGRRAPSLGFPKLGQLLSLTLQDIHDQHRHIYSPRDVGRMIPPGGAPFRPPAPAVLEDAADDVTRFQYQDVKTYLLDDILTKVDRMSMANSLEVRVPLLDHKVVEFMFSVPMDSKLNRANGRVATKTLLKEVAGTYFDRSFLERPKMGFGIPAREWLLGPLSELVRDSLGEWSSELFDWIDFGQTQEIVTDFYANQGRRYSASHVWILLIMKLWFDDVHRGLPAAAGASA